MMNFPFYRGNSSYGERERDQLGAFIQKLANFQIFQSWESLELYMMVA